MSEEKRARTIWRNIYRPTVGAWVVLLLFWGIWFLVAKRIPELSQIKLEWSGEVVKTIVLPFKISRWWDFLVVPLWPITYSSIYGSKWFEKLENWKCEDINLIANNCLWGIIVGGLVFNIGAFYGYLVSFIVGAVFLLAASIYSEIATYVRDENHFLSFSAKNTVYALLLNFSTGMSIGLLMIFSIGLVPGLVMGLVGFLVMTLFQYTLVKFSRLIYYFFKFGALPWLGIKIDDC